LSYESLRIETEENKDKIIRLNNLLNQLPPKQKEVIYLKFYKGLSNEQISQILNINYQSVKNHVYRSIVMLRSYYGNEAKIN
jgi:RNA polymerase sigma factor (sigma-70 family)